MAGTKTAPVVMVDDSRADREIARICYEMSSLGQPWLEFSGGPDFLVYAHQVSEGKEPPPTVVLMDLNMPGMTGIEAVERMNDAGDGRDMTIMLLTSSLNPADRERAQRAGIDHHASKLADIDEYVAFFESLRRFVATG